MISFYTDTYMYVCVHTNIYVCYLYTYMERGTFAYYIHIIYMCACAKLLEEYGMRWRVAKGVDDSKLKDFPL